MVGSAQFDGWRELVVRSHHRSTSLLGALLVVAAGIFAVGAAPVSENAQADAVTIPLGQVIPAPASVRAGDRPTG